MNMLRHIFLLFLLNNISNAIAVQQTPKLVFPVECKLGKTCYIQHYVDMDPSNSKRDVGGGDLTNNNHSGTDIAIPTYDDIKKGINVVAAEKGRVLRIRDGEQDNSDRDNEFDSKKPCGNGIIIQHSYNWQTQYCHLRLDSIRVKPGEKVQKGQVIAQVGASGHANFPHLHFAIRKNSQVVDPFASQLWAKKINYVGTGLIDMGMSEKPLKLADVVNNRQELNNFSPYDTSFIAWTRVFGVKAGDSQQFIFIRPDGQIYMKPVVSEISKDYKEWFAYAGFPITDSIRFSHTGLWHVRYELKDKNENVWHTLAERQFTIE